MQDELELLGNLLEYTRNSSNCGLPHAQHFTLLTVCLAKVRRFHSTRHKIIQAKIDKLFVARFIREKDEGWQVCVDYTNLNDILMFYLNEDKTTFVTPQGLYCYRVMPFGLKNVGTTYQKLMTKIFKPLIGQTVEVYIDDIVVKSEIESRPRNTRSKQKKKKKLQRLTNRLTALGSFIVRFTNKLRSFFLTFKGASTFGWIDKCEQAFEVVKHHLTEPPILSNPKSNEELYMYLVVSEYAYQPRLSLKREVMIDFIAELPKKQTHLNDHPEEQWWTLHVDRASRVSKFGIGLILQSLIGEPMKQTLRLNFSISNNEAEYEAILVGQDLALMLLATKLEIRNDSQLIVGHIQREYEAKNEHMARYLAMVEDQLKKLDKVDALADIAVVLPINETIMLLVYLKVASSITSELCLSDPEAKYVLANFMKAYAAITQVGELWPTRDAESYVKRCDRCQQHAPIPHVPLEALNPVTIDPLPIVVAEKKFLLVATNYISKWVELEAYASIKDKDVSNVVFQTFYLGLNIKNLYSTPHYPQNNRQAEATNKTLLNALKRKLERAKGKWMDELPGVIWAYRTTSRRPMGATPFTLAYGAITQYNKRARPRFFQPGFLVLRRIFENIAEVGAGKLQANWEEPYVITKKETQGHTIFKH
uniref:Uncharacterized protein n=1 Tax=Vitis vinifera TaxID=29760 RepID=A5AHL8_VITVI|nr:hypothetical protein VITISV_022345 [Vitis vinifera]